MGTDDDKEQNDVTMEKQAKSSRDNQQILLYLFVAFTMILTWGLGLMEFSFMWTFALIVLTFFVWHSKVMKLVEEHLRYKEVQLHRKRALRHGETAEWLNLVINRWWLFSAGSIRNMMKRHLDPLLLEVKPAYIENIELSSFVIGDTPHVKYVKVFEPSSGTSGLQTASWTPSCKPGPEHQLVLEGDIGLHSEDFKIVFKTRLGSKWMGMNLDVIIEKLNITGCIQLVLTMNMDTPFPHISNAAVSFREKPEVWFNIRMLKAVQMMEIPMLKSWIHSLVMDGLTEALVDPGKIDFKMSSGHSYAPSKSKAKTRARGVLTVTVGCDQTKGSMFNDDLRYCILRVGEQRQYTEQTQGPTAWTDTCSFLVESIITDKLTIKYKSKRLLSTYNLAQFDLSLSDFPFEHQKVIETSVEEKVSRWQTGGSVKLNLQFNYHPLTSVESHVETLTKQPSRDNLVVGGVMYVCIHSAANLLALDRNGTSDPYCIVFRNGKKLKTTHYVCRTRSPSWEVNAEFLVSDFTRNMLSFMVYDWDGHNASEDDFLGSAYFVPTQDEPYIIKKSLTLGYNVLNQGQVDSSHMGTISVSVIFRPVKDVSIKSDVNELPNADNCDYSDKHKMFMNSAVLVHASLQWSKKQKLLLMKDKKGPDSMGVGNILSMGHGLLELNILRAKDLVAMDSNGFSDPFCEVKIGNERKFTTSIKKKTLNPTWEEWVTMQLPKCNEMLEIVVWDRDPFFKKDFLGSISFSLDDLKRHSQHPVNDGWHELQRIRSGYVQLHFKVISEDVTPQPVDISVTPDSMLENGSVIDEQDLTPEHNWAPSNGGGNMSPIQEIGSVAAKLSTALITVPGITDKIHSSDSDQVSPQPTRSKSLHNEPFGGNSNTLPTRLTPITSSVRLSPGKRFSSLRLTRQERLDDSSLESPSLVQRSASTSEKYFDVHGRVLRTQGYQGNNQAYCKIRLDGRSHSERSRKSSIGKVLCKTKSFDTALSQESNVNFNIDNGRGISKDALLIVDIKSSSKDHIVTRGFTLAELLADMAETTTWLELDDGLKVEIYLCQGFINEPNSTTTKRRGLTNILRKRK